MEYQRVSRSVLREAFFAKPHLLRFLFSAVPNVSLLSSFSRDKYIEAPYFVRGVVYIICIEVAQGITKCQQSPLSLLTIL